MPLRLKLLSETTLTAIFVACLSASHPADACDEAREQRRVMLLEQMRSLAFQPPRSAAFPTWTFFQTLRAEGETAGANE